MYKWYIHIGIGLMIAFSSCTVAVQPVRPEPQVEVIPSSPGVNYVWVGGYYGYRNRNYVWTPGYYRIPPRGRTRWVNGGYNPHRFGRNKFHRGHWN